MRTAGATAGAAGAGRVNYVDGLRALAALYVLVHHAILQYYQPWGVLPNSAVVKGAIGFFNYGRFAVDTFIVISGFCLALPVIKAQGLLTGGAATFFKRRVRRIVPTYYASLLLCLLLIATVIGEKTGTHWDVSTQVTGGGLLAHLLLLQDVFYAKVGGQINHVFWSIAVESHIYLLFPGIVWLWARRGINAVLLATGVIGLGLGWWAHGTALEGVNPQYLFLFGLGVAAAEAAYGRNAFSSLAPRRWFLIAAVAAIPPLVVAFRGPWTVVSKFWIYLDPFWGLASAALLAGLGRAKSGLLRGGVELAPLRWIGAFSFSLYLIHAALLQIVWLVLNRTTSLSYPAAFGVSLVLGLPLIVVASWLFYLLFEKPFLPPPASAKRKAPIPVLGQSAGGVAARSE